MCKVAYFENNNNSSLGARSGLARGSLGARAGMYRARVKFLCNVACAVALYEAP